MPEPRELLTSGIRYERAGALAKALKNYTAALENTKDPAVISEALRRQADVFRIQCEWSRALAAVRDAARVAHSAKLQDLWAEALNAEAAIHQTRGDFELARTLYERMLDVRTSLRIRGIALQNLGGLAALASNLEQAEQYFLESSECFKLAGYARGEIMALTNYSAVALDRGNPELAKSVSEKALAAAKNLDDLELVAVATLNKAQALAQMNAYAEAEELAGIALGYFGVSENKWRRVRCLLLLGDMNVQQKNLASARRFYETGLRLAEEIEASAEIRLFRDRLSSV